MNGYVKANILSFALLVGVVAVSSMFGGMLAVAMVILWVFVTIMLNYMEFLNGKDIAIRLARAPKRGFFSAQVNQLILDYSAIDAWKQNSQAYDDASSITKSYDLISSQMNNIMESAIKYIKTYDYISKPAPVYLNDLVRQGHNLVHKLHELQDLILKVDDSTSDVDISYVDDLLDALREMKD